MGAVRAEGAGVGTTSGEDDRPGESTSEIGSRVDGTSGGSGRDLRCGVPAALPDAIKPAPASCVALEASFLNRDAIFFWRVVCSEPKTSDAER